MCVCLCVCVCVCVCEREREMERERERERERATTNYPTEYCYSSPVCTRGRCERFWWTERRRKWPRSWRSPSTTRSATRRPGNTARNWFVHHRAALSSQGHRLRHTLSRPAHAEFPASLVLMKSVPSAPNNPRPPTTTTTTTTNKPPSPPPPPPQTNQQQQQQQYQQTNNKNNNKQPNNNNKINHNPSTTNKISNNKSDLVFVAQSASIRATQEKQTINR